MPRIQENIGLSTNFGNNRSKTKYPIFTCTYRTMRPTALDPVTLTAFIPLRYAYRSMPYIGLSTGTNKHNSGYQQYILGASIPNSILGADCNQLNILCVNCYLTHKLPSTRKIYYPMQIRRATKSQPY